MYKDPATMSAAEINKALDRLHRQSCKLTARLIAAGLGHTPLYELMLRGDVASVRYCENVATQRALRLEIDARYGPGAPSRLPTHPRGSFGPSKRAPN